MKKLLALLISSLFAVAAFAQPAAADKAVATGQPGHSPSEGINKQNQKMQAVNDPDAQPALTQHQVQKIKERRAAKKAKKGKTKRTKAKSTDPQAGKPVAPSSTSAPANPASVEAGTSTGAMNPTPKMTERATK